MAAWMLRLATASPARNSRKGPLPLRTISAAARQQSRVVDLAAIRGLVLELLVQVGHGQRGVFDHHLIYQPLIDVLFAIVTAEDRQDSLPWRRTARTRILMVILTLRAWKIFM